MANSMRYAHHMLARLMAEPGRNEAEASLLSGYTPDYIRHLRADPAFQELVSHYRDVGTAAPDPDAAQRMRALGISAVDELQQRLTSDPTSWTKRELLEVSEVMLVKGRERGRDMVVAGSSGVNVNVKFVSARREEPIGQLIDHEPRQIDSEGS